MAGAPPASATRRRHGSALWLQGLACGTVIAVAAPSAMLVAVLALPGLLALLLDREPGRPMARNVLLFAAVVAIPSLAALWHAGRGWSASLDLLSQADRVAMAWAIQGAGWLMGEVAPLLVRLGLDAAASTHTARLRARRARYEEDWGLPPAREPGAD